MLRSVRDLLGYTIVATDGDIGRASDFYFDDEQWTIRYLVVDAGNWLTGRTVLISPMAITNANWEQKRIDLSLTREQVMNSPSIAEDQPVSRQWETEYYSYYRWPYYWGGVGVWGAWPTPLEATTAPYPASSVPSSVTAELEARPNETHLRSTKEVIGYDIKTLDGSAGSVEDFLVDDENWSIRQIMVDTTSWWPGGEVLIAPDRAQRVDWPRREVFMDLSREDIQSRPEFRPSGPTAH